MATGKHAPGMKVRRDWGDARKRLEEPIDKAHPDPTAGTVFVTDVTQPVRRIANSEAVTIAEGVYNGTAEGN